MKTYEKPSKLRHREAHGVPGSASRDASGVSQDVAGGSRDASGPSRDALGASQVCLETPWGRFGTSREHLGTSRVAFEASPERLGCLQGPALLGLRPVRQAQGPPGNY